MSTIPVTAGIPGVFYSRPGPGKEPYARPGELVQAGQVIGLLEIRRQFAEVTAPASGLLVEFLVEDGAMLVPGEPLATIETS